MTKRELRRKRKAVGESMEGEGKSGSTLGLDEECSSESTSSGDRHRGEERSKKREDRAHRRRVGREEEEKGKGIVVEMGMGEYVVRQRCAFESICALIEELSEAQKEAVRGTVWGPGIGLQADCDGLAYGQSPNIGVECRCKSVQDWA